jgi:hypothetical protein
MLIHRISAPLKQRLPSPLWRKIRGLGTAFVTPILFSLDSGHARSALRGRAVDREGAPLPWYTYPAVDLLRAKDLSDCRVLEFGAGNSTIWWAARAREVVALEDDPTWCAELAPLLPANVSLRQVGRSPAAMADALRDEARFDIAVVDGLDRLRAARLALELVAEGGPFWSTTVRGTGGRRHPIRLSTCSARPGSCGSTSTATLRASCYLIVRRCSFMAVVGCSVVAKNRSATSSRPQA